jgi:hypothetical protein
MIPGFFIVQRWHNRRHQLANRLEKNVNGVVMLPYPPLQLGKLARQFPIGCGQLAHLHKGALDGDVDLHGTITLQHAGELSPLPAR